MINDLGKTFGYLTAIESEKDSKGYNTRYICTCICGNTHSAARTHLRRGLITHCGCRRSIGSKHIQWKGVGDISGDFWYSHIVRSANGSKVGNRERKPKELTVSIEEAWDLFLIQEGKCKLTALPLKFPGKSKDKDWNASLDRIDSNKGYINGNVQWVHKHVNIMKNKFENDYFLHICKLITINNFKS